MNNILAAIRHAVLAAAARAVLAVAAACGLLAACGSLPAPPPPIPGSTADATPAATRAAAPALRQVRDPGHVTGTLTGPCRLRDRGRLPDSRCTPGSVDPAVTAARLCSPAYTTRAYRPPEAQIETLKRHVLEPAYGIADVPGTVVVDHLVPLQAGGANDASNLWLEPEASSRAKDRVEQALHDWVCAGGMRAQDRLVAAQAAIAAAWTTAEARLGIGGSS